MSFPLAASTVEEGFLKACSAELEALKPGNVHIHAAGHGMDVDDFKRAAAAAAPHIARRGISVGRRVRSAIDASMAAARCNTNLGIILLCAPLAQAACESVAGDSLAQRLSAVLSGLDRTDAADVFAAIAMANPGGLGEADKGDVHSEADITLLEAMRLASSRDRIALAYVTDFEDIFQFALPVLQEAKQTAERPDLAVSTLHMTLLARFPDTHIARKFGNEIAEAVRVEARDLLALSPEVITQAELCRLEEFDADLKARGLNPGTTADFVVATLFTETISAQVADPRST